MTVADTGVVVGGNVSSLNVQSRMSVRSAGGCRKNRSVRSAVFLLCVLAVGASPMLQKSSRIVVFSKGR